MSGNSNQQTKKQPNPVFQRLANSPQFVSLVKEANKLGLDPKMIMKQAEQLFDTGHDVDYIGSWLLNLVKKAGEYVEKQRMMNAAGVQNPGPLNGSQQGQDTSPQGQPYTDNNMPPGTYLSVRPNLHCSTQVEMIVILIHQLQEESVVDPKGVNPYGFRNLSVNQFLDNLAEKQFFSGDIPEQIPTGEFEDVESKDEKTGKVTTKQIPIMKPNPHHSLMKKKLQAEAAGKYQKRDITVAPLADWMGIQDMTGEKIDNPWTPTVEERDFFVEHIGIMRHNLQNTLRVMNELAYVNIAVAEASLHTPDQYKDEWDKTERSEEVRKIMRRKYNSNSIKIKPKALVFLQMYLHSWPQSDQKGIYTNFLMMGLDKNSTW